MKEYYAKHKKEVQEYNAKYHKKHQAERREYYAKYYIKNRAKLQEYSREYRKKNRTLCNKRAVYSQREKYLAWLTILHEIGFDKCSKCGYDKCFSAIDFHHDPPRNGGERLWAKWNRIAPTAKRVEIIKKQIPLCKNCHMELHQKLREGM